MRTANGTTALVVALLALSPAPGARAATLTVNVTDPAAAPVIDAVVYATSSVPGAVGKAPAGAEIAQVKLTFVPLVTVAQTGASISFPNRDTVRHHVYSFSPAKLFELRLYAGVPATVVFDKPGLVVLGCNIHDRMVAYVMVVDTPYFGKTAANGSVKMDGLPAGDYKVTVWHPRMPTQAPAVAVVVAGDATLNTAVVLGPAT